MKKYLLLSFLSFAVALAMAQDRTVTGKVTDSESGEPVPGANVVVKGSSKGTITDFDGNFEISVSDGTTLVFSFIGFKSQEVPVGALGVVNVSLELDVAQLNEVVVIGYGQIEKKDATGSVASVKSDDFNGGVIASPEQLFQGKVAGVQITGSSGEPGAGVSIRIRGSSSVRNGNGPLFVVDGIPLSGESTSAGGVDLGRGSQAASNPLNFLNPNDIESIDILKDASATAIYGSRGANGVVIITTKSGKGAKSQLSYSSSVSVATVANTLDLLNRDQFLDGAEARGAIRSEIDFDGNTDWQDEIFQAGISHQHDLSYGNSYKNGDYRVSVGYGNQQGIMEKSELERIAGRINLNHRLFNEKLKLGFQGTFSSVNNSQLPLSDDAGFEGDLIAAIYMANPTWDADVNVQPTQTNLNPLSMIEFSQDETRTNRALIGVSAEYEILPGFSFKINGGFDRTSSLRESMTSGLLNRNSRSTAGNGIGAISDWDIESDLLEAFFNYSKEIGNSNFSALVGYSYQRFETKGVTNMGWGFNTNNLDDMVDALDGAASAIRSQIEGSYQQWGYDADGNTSGDTLFVNRLVPTPQQEILDASVASGAFNAPDGVRSASENRFNEIDELQSFFFRANYTLQDKYLFTATLRADGSSRFGENNRYGYFPSFSAAWRISDEGFLPSSVSDLKLRAGWGITGNQEIPHNLHQARQKWGVQTSSTANPIEVGDGGNVNRPTLGSVTFANPDLKWEETKQLNVGFDFGLIGGRLNGTVDFYNKVTTNLLIKINSAQPAPQPFRWTNLDAEVVNNGVELTLNYAILNKSDLKWDVTTNYSFNDNEVKGLETPINTGRIHGQGLTDAFAQRIADGQPLYTYYLRDFAGFDATGNNIYVDGDVQQYVGKSPLPTTNFGLSTNVSYKRWTLSMYTYGQFGHYVYNNTANALFTAGSLGNGRNVTTDVLSSGESNTNAPSTSTRFLDKGDFLRLQNLAIAYNFDVSNNSVFNSLSLSVTGQNLLLITGYDGLDPEVNSNKQIEDIPSFGIEYSPYPRPRVFTLGLKATF